MSRGLRLGGVVALVLGILLCVVHLASGPAAPEGKLTYRWTFKDRVISGAYKAYGAKECIVPMWLAKTVLRNDSTARITNLRVRYKVTEYADWDSWHVYAAVDPSQTVVDCYHPIFSSSCARLTSRAPADLQMEGEYTDSAGEKHTFSETTRITMLSKHEFIFSDLTAEERTASFQDADTYSPLLAAWVSSSDEPVARLASMANKSAGGLGASASFEDCIKVMEALYESMRTIHISYQHPPVMLDPGLSYDIKSVQSLQYPRDTIQKRSGTCIDLAILYAAMLNSVNIHPFLVSMDGHCFPMAATPSGNFIPVEATCVGDGYEKSKDFLEAFKIAMKNWEDLQKNGRFTLVDVRQCWMNGIGNPELESLPPDILEKWGIAALMEPQQQGGGGAQQQGGGEQDVGPPQPVPPAGNLTGQWAVQLIAATGEAVGGVCQIATQGNQVQLGFTFAYQTMGQDGMTYDVREQDIFVGTIQGGQIQATCTDQASMTMNGMQAPVQGLPFQLILVAGADGRSLQGQVTNSMGMTATLVLQR